MSSQRLETRDAGRKSHAIAYPSICRLIESRLGLSMERGSLPGSLEQFIERKMTTLRITDEAVFASVLSCASEMLMGELVDAVTVPYSWLFRDYEQLYDSVGALGEPESERRRLQVWVPACASGEDAYSISAVACLLGKRIELLATDINGRVLDVAVAGNYGAWSARSVPECHARQMSLRADGMRTFCSEVRERIAFANHNLVESPPRSAHAHGGWDLIVCRNVLIYFARVQAQRVLAQLRGALAPQGLLVLGASDIVLELPGGLRTVDIRGRLAFRRHDPGLELSHPELPLTLGNAKNSRHDAAQRAELTAKNDPPTAAAFLPEPNLARHSEAAQFNPGHAEISDCDETDTGVDEMLEGIMRYLSGELSEAAQSLRAALFHCPQLWPAAYYLALCYDELGRSLEAKREYQRTADLIARKVLLPQVPNHDFSFLERDIKGLAQRRAAGRTK